jgi:hypothetical protein
MKFRAFLSVADKFVNLIIMPIGYTKLVKCLFLSLLFFLSITAYAQTYYPLETGNRWDYGYYLSTDQSTYSFSVSITGDTLMANGKRYAVEQSVYSGTRFLRQDGLQVYQFTVSGDDSLLYDFSYTYLWGETLTVSNRGDYDLITTVNSHHATVFDANRTIWTFYTYATDRSFYRELKIADSIGCYEIDTKNEPTFYLIGAIINGRRYETTLTGTDYAASLPQGYVLHQNYPNPFNPATTIRYDVPMRSNVTIRVFNILGQEVRTLVNEEKSPGSYAIEFNAGTLPSGLYYYRLTAGNYNIQEKMVLIR